MAKRGLGLVYPTGAGTFLQTGVIGPDAGSRTKPFKGPPGFLRSEAGGVFQSASSAERYPNTPQRLGHVSFDTRSTAESDSLLIDYDVVFLRPHHNQ